MTSDVVSHLRRLESQRLAAIAGGDADVWISFTLPTSSYARPVARTWTREHYLGGLVDGSINYQCFEALTPIHVLADAHLAVLRYRSEIEISVGDGALGRLACWHLDVYQRDDSSWRCRWSPATDTIPD